MSFISLFWRPIGQIFKNVEQTIEAIRARSTKRPISLKRLPRRLWHTCWSHAVVKIQHVPFVYPLARIWALTALWDFFIVPGGFFITRPSSVLQSPSRTTFVVARFQVIWCVTATKTKYKTYARTQPSVRFLCCKLKLRRVCILITWINVVQVWFGLMIVRKPRFPTSDSVSILFSDI